VKTIPGTQRGFEAKTRRENTRIRKVKLWDWGFHSGGGGSLVLEAIPGEE